MDEKRRLQVNFENVVSSVPEMKEEKDRLSKERDKLERELERQKRLARELQDSSKLPYKVAKLATTKIILAYSPQVFSSPSLDPGTRAI